MPDWLEILLLAVASMFWPTLITIVVLALRVPQPLRVLAWFLLGGLLTTITIGLALVFGLQGSSVASGSGGAFDPIVYIVAGAVSLAAAAYLARRKRPHAIEEQAAPAVDTKPGFSQRAVDRGGVVAFFAGVVLNIVPGAFPLIALRDIAQLDAGDATKVASVVVFYVIMFSFAEVPIIGYLLAPERTTALVNEFNTWLRRNTLRIAIAVLVVVGIYLIARGIVHAVS